VRKLAVLALCIPGVIGCDLVLVVTNTAESTYTSDAYYAYVWLPQDDTLATAQQVRAMCGSTEGAASVSPLKRGVAPVPLRRMRRRGKPIYTFTIAMRWGPDDPRSNSLLDCLDGPDVASYSIPI
jgi:hypothetical protein